MKKFLLLLVGVLFALSAKADYYLVGDMNGWKTNETYKFEAVGDGTYKLVVPGTIEAGQTYKICAGMNADNSINWSVNIGAWEKDFQLSYDSPYGAKNASDSQNFKWKEPAKNPIIYLSNFVNDSGINKVTITVYKESSVYISGNFKNANNEGTWVEPGTNDDFKFTYAGGGVYTLDLSGKYSLTGSKEFKIYKDTNGWNDGTQYGNTNNSPLVVGTAYKATISGANIVVKTDVTNPVITFDAITQYITITEKSSSDVYTYKYSGDDTSWASNEVPLNIVDGKISITRTFTNNTEFGIREFKNGTENAWWWGTNPSANTTITELGTAYGAVIEDNSKSNGKNWIFGLETGEYTLTFDPEAKTITFTSSSTPDPEPTTYYYRVHGSIFTKGVWNEKDSDWYTQDCMTDNHDGTYSFTATIKAGSFGIKRLTSDKVGDINGNNTWINSPNDNVTIKEGTEYATQIKNNNGYDFSTNLNGEYTIVFNPTANTVKIVSPTVTPKNYVWRLHTNIITGSWPAADNTLADYAMTKQADGVTWVWEGRVSNSGFFGFKRLNEGDKPSNYTPWFYSNCNGNASYTEADYTVAVNTAYTGKFKNGNDDASGHDWKWDLPAGRYRIELNAADVNAPVIKIISLNTDFSGLKYVISGTFNGWTAPDTYLGKGSEPFTFVYNEETKKYVWRYKGTMKNVSFKISNMTDRATDNDPHWGKAFGYSYKNDGTVADLSLNATYQMRRTNVPGEDVFINFQDINTPLTLVNPTFTLNPANMTLVVENHPVEEPENTFYWIKGDFGTENESWELKAMSPVGDGTWTWQGHFNKAAAAFGVMKSASKDNKTQTGWLNTVSDGNLVAANPGVLYTCYWEGSVPNGTTCNNWTSKLKTDVEYRFVFDPTATPATLIIYSLAPVEAHYEALESSSDAGKALGQAVNNLFVELKPSEYLPVEATDSYSLQIGGKVIANGVSVGEGLYRFDFLPYFVKDQELTLVASESKSVDIVVKSVGKIDINASVGTVWYEGSKYDNAWYATIKVPYKTTGKAVYNYPHVTYTRSDQEGSFEANVIWTEGGFTIEVPDAIEVNSDGLYKGGEINFNFKFTPVIPFAVYTAPVASSASLNAPAADATNLTLQMFGGTLNTYPLTITATTGINVSGVEGVAVENEEAPVEYYNLQGQRVNGELAPGIYIRRQGTTVTKVRF